MAAKKGQSSDPNLFSLKFWVSAMKELGIPAFIVFFFTMMFLFFATEAQKQEFVDKFFLFKDVNQNPYPFSFVVAALLFIIIVQYVYFKRIMNIKEGENKRLGEEKSELQKKLLNRRLNSSEK